tara:strand:- start:588 stop:1142 length:555 start_codon:yes stop_codon:yes gene_type:complete
MNSKMPPWFSQLITIQKEQGNSKSCRWIQFATLGLDNTPRVRTVVFRGWSDSYEMILFTDKRSQKYYELERNNNVEIIWLFYESKCQFRFRGNSKIDNSKDRLLYWNKLNTKAKLMWGWPRPGSEITSLNKNNKLEKKTSTCFNNFCLLKIDIFHVDQLLLCDPTHVRNSWRRTDEWIEKRINP